MCTLCPVPASMFENEIVRAWPGGAARQVVSKAIRFALMCRAVPPGEHVVGLNGEEADAEEDPVPAPGADAEASVALPWNAAHAPAAASPIKTMVRSPHSGAR